MKKFFSLVLALVMALSLTTVAFGAVTEVTTPEQLAAALTADAEQIDVVLKNDITVPVANLSKYGQTPGSGEYKMGGENTKAINIDLGGYKLTLTTSYMTAIGAKNENATITIKNGSMNGTGNSATTWNINDLMFANCNYVFEKVTFDKEVALVNTGKTTTMKNVTINGTGDYYALWIQAEGQTVEIDGLTVNTPGRGIKIDEQYVGDENLAKVTMNVSNAKFTTAKKSAIMVKSAAGADIAASNCNISGVAADSTNLVWVDEDSAASANLVTVTGATGIAEGTTGHVAQLNGVKYEKLAAAVAAAAAAGDTIELLADCDEDVTVGKELTFDFNGYTYSGVVTPAAGYTYMDGVVKKTPAASGTTSTGSVTSGTVTPGKAKLYLLATAGTSMTELSDITKIEMTTVTGKLVNDTPVYVPDIYKLDGKFYVEVAKADATHALKNNGAYVYLVSAGTASNVDAVIAKFATAVVLDQYVAAAEDVECGDAVKGTKGAAIYKSGTDAYYADGSNWAVFKGEFVTYDKNTKVAYKEHKWDAKSIIVKATDVKGTKVPVTIECEDCEKTFSIVPSAKFDNTWVKGVNYTTDKAVDKYNTAAVKYYIVLENATYTGTYVPSVPSTDKVQSADTFDAGIAMYVGMSVMAAAGSAVVIGKKKD